LTIVFFVFNIVQLSCSRCDILFISNILFSSSLPCH